MSSFHSSLLDQFRPFLFQEGTLIPITGICTDSRSLKKGELFVAIVGEQFDGHDFIADILDNAVAIVCHKLPDIRIPSAITIFLVPDTLDAYHQIARLYLTTKPKLIRIAITGSSGKTSTKEWLSLLLAHRYRVYKNPGNFNNLIGVPQSALEVTDEEVAIFEVGSGKPGDIAKLRDIVDPQWVIVTGIGKAHLQFFSSLDAISEEKASLCQKSSQCFAPHDILFANSTFASFRKVNPMELFSSIIPLHERGFEVMLENFSFLFPFFGLYNISNLALAVSVALELGITSEQISQTLFPSLPSYRSKIIFKGKSQLILDCYNANPSSMQASLDALSFFPEPPILILGDMLELGEEALSLHQELVEFLNQKNFPLIFFIGNFMSEAALIYKNPSYSGKTLEELASLIVPIFQNKHTIFIKASRGMHLEDITRL